MSYHHLTTYERGRIEKLHALGYSNRAISKRLGRHRSTIDREISRNAAQAEYNAERAQSAYSMRRKNSVSRGKYSRELAQKITKKLAATWSPEQITNTATLGIISFKTIYNWLYTGKLPGTDVSVLRHKGKRRKPEKRGKFAMGTPISERPAEVKHRQTFGHWELDAMVSSCGESKGCFATFVERKSRLYTALMISDRSRSIHAGSNHTAFSRITKRLL